MKYLAQVNIGKTFNTPFSTGARSLGDAVSLLLNIAFVFAGIGVLVMFLIGGFKMVQGAGQNNPEAAKKGKEAATAAVLGFVIIFVAYWVVRLIEVMTGINFITNPGI